MQRSPNERGPERRKNAERDASQPIAGQPRSDEEDEDLQGPEQVPSFLTARELQARDTAKGADDEDDAGERQTSLDDDADELPKAKGGKGRK